MANSLIFRNVSKVPTLQDTARYNKYNIAYRDTYSLVKNPNNRDPNTSTFNSVSLSTISTIYLYTTIDTSSKPGYYSLTGLISKSIEALFNPDIASTFTGYFYSSRVGWDGAGQTGPWQWIQDNNVSSGIVRCATNIQHVTIYGNYSSCQAYMYPMYIYKGSTPYAGSFIDTIIAPTTYPTNGQYNGYWYIKQ